MAPAESLPALRSESRSFEKALPTAERKALGQFFTGIKVSRLLAHLAIEDGTERVLDPMAGTGDLLDAVSEASSQRKTCLRQLDAIEIHEASADLCRRRLHLLAEHYPLSCRTLCADAFSSDAYAQLAKPAYDLVIANPPYVRYQSMNGRSETTRQGLSQTVSRYLRSPSQGIWAPLAASYSGLADLSIPAWLLCALLVRPGGRLALITPATWRSREYAHVVRYLMLRAFTLEFVIEDSQPSWFPDALVGTHLIVARRLSNETTEIPLRARTAWSSAQWVSIGPAAASATSIVGAAFRESCPEAAFAKWCRNASLSEEVPTLTSRPFCLRREWASLRPRLETERWLGVLEPPAQSTPPSLLRAAHRSKLQDPPACAPDRLRDLLPTGFLADKFVSILDLGIHVGQGLRTGCNRFFYVKLLDRVSSEWSTVITNAAFGSRTLLVPTAVLRPVIHRQKELGAWRCGTAPTRVLDLRRWVLPEDMEAVLAALPLYQRSRETPPRPMHDDLVQFVRDAGNRPPTGSTNGKLVPDLSAVRTNARPARGNVPPRFWYMLPDFMPRHCPSAFVPRIVHDSPRTYANDDPNLLVDANFSTFWSNDPRWTPDLLSALLNSLWCTTLMEATGTRLGGGALKLEASHLKRLPVPCLNDALFTELHATMESRNASVPPQIDRIVLRALLLDPSKFRVDTLATALHTVRSELRAARRSLTP